MTQRRTSRQDQFLETAAHLFRQKGCHHTRMQNLADALGMQKGSLYYDVEGKRDLLGMLNWTQEWFSPRHRYTALEPAGTPANSVPRAL